MLRVGHGARKYEFAPGRSASSEGNLLNLQRMTPALQTVFNIGPAEGEELDTRGCRLIVDAGQRHLQYAILNPANTLLAVGAYNAKNQQTAEWMPEVGQLPFLDRTFASIDVFLNLSESVLVPESLYQSEANSALLNLVHGDLRNGLMRNEEAGSLGIRNVYRLPDTFQRQLNEQFPGARFSHIYTCLMRQLASPAIASGDHLHLFFYNHMFLALLIHRSRLQLVQTCPYDLPEDVSYQLLNICEQVGIEASLLPVSIAGAIDPASPLFVEVLKYFMEVQLADDMSGVDFGSAFAGYPTHYFQTFSLLASCAS
jgi:hypothetical protein